MPLPLAVVTAIKKIADWLSAPVSIAPLVTLRVILGAMLLFSTIRFMSLGWVEDHYLLPVFHFHYPGFEWVVQAPDWGIYFIFYLLIISSVGVILGWQYRLAALLQFVLFTYIELLDLTYYLNHYYFVSIATALLVLVPANRSFSLDAANHPGIRLDKIPRWTIFIFQLQLGIVYFYAGIWKISHEWLIEALPLKIWLPAGDKTPILGPLLDWEYTPWLFSWAGMLYDTTIVFWLSWRPSRPLAYLSVITFHTITGILFQIGVFPLVMTGATLVFFSEEWHEDWQAKARILLRNIGGSFRSNQQLLFAGQEPTSFSGMSKKRYLGLGKPCADGVKTPAWLVGLLVLHFTFQILFPWRYVLHDGNVFWTEQGYRFAWRVMLMEKAGTATFFVKDGKNGREGQVVNTDFLNPHQEKQMAMQPDMILQYAYFLKEHYQKNGMESPQIRAEVYITLNGRPSQRYFDPHLVLNDIQDLAPYLSKPE